MTLVASAPKPASLRLTALVHVAARPILRWLTGRGLRRFRAINRLYLWYVRRLAPKTVRLENHLLQLDDTDALKVLGRGSFEPGTTSLVKSLIRPGDLVVDVGAHIGYYSCLFARLVGPRGRVMAFEPDGSNFRLLERNVRANGYRNVAAFHAAATDATAPVMLYRSPIESGDHRTHPVAGWSSVSVQGFALDDFLATEPRPVRLVKLDVQGAEGRVLSGLQRTLLSNHDIMVLLEFWPPGLRLHGTEPRELLDRLAALGFAIRRVEPTTGDLQKVGVDDLLRAAEEKHDTPNLFCARNVPSGSHGAQGKTT